VSAIAQDFYVSTTGSDSTGDGSPANPWATITNALNNVPDWSVILVQPGLYEGRVRLVGTFASGGHGTLGNSIPCQTSSHIDGSNLL